MTLQRKLIAEFLGTFLLVLLAVGAAVFGIGGKVATPDEITIPASGVLGVALAFGFVLVFAAYAFGPVSGCHVNPAVTVAMVVARKMDPKEAGAYIVAQFLGAIAAGGVLKLFVTSFGATDRTGGLGTNGYDNGHINMAGAFVLEVLLTFAFVLVILLVTHSAAQVGVAGLAIGTALTVVHLVGIPLDGTSVNPARSFGPALFAGGDALGQVWLFLLAPIVGGVLAAVVYPFTRANAEA